MTCCFMWVPRYSGGACEIFNIDLESMNHVLHYTGNPADWGGANLLMSCTNEEEYEEVLDVARCSLSNEWRPHHFQAGHV